MPSTRRSPSRRTAPRFHVESLEARDLPAGGLAQPTLLPDGVRLALNGQTVDFTGTTPTDATRIKSFFSAADGAAGTTAVAGTLSFAGRAVAGSFALSEFSGGTAGVAVAAADARVAFGGAVGVELSDADGAFALLTSGVAGKITAEDATDGVGAAVVGLAGLKFDSAGGLSFEVNTTGGAVNKLVPTPLGNMTLGYSANVNRLAGPAEFRVQKADGQSVVRVAGTYSVTDAGGTVAVAGENVGLELYAAGKRALLLGSATAGFTLSAAAGFQLTPNTFVVGDFSINPFGGPFQPGDQTFPATQKVKAGTTLGPLALTNTGFVVTGLSVTNTAVEVMAGLSSSKAALAFQKGGTSGAAGSDPITMEAETLAGTFALAGSIAGGAVSGFTASGKFAVTAQTFTLDVPELLNATAAGLAITYDPGAAGEQDLIAADQVTVNVPPLGLTGTFDPSDTSKALVIRTDGFAFGQGTLTYNGSKAVGPLTVENPYVRLTDFSFTTADGVHVGQFAVGAAKLSAAVGSLNATGEEVEAAVDFDAAGQVEGVSFTVGTLAVDLAGGIVTLEASDVGLYPLATGEETIFEAGGAVGTLSVAGVTVTGTAGAFSATAAGEFTGPESLGFEVDFTGKSQEESDQASKGFKWPSFLPVKLRTVAVDFPEFAEDPEKVLVTLSAAVDGTYGPVHLGGSVGALVIDPVRLARGDNPFVSIDGFTVEASGKLFGAEVSGTLVGGVIRLDAQGNVTDEDDEAVDSVVYAGLEGSLSFASVGGLGVRIGFSERGLLQAYFNADVPVLLDPTTGLSLRDFRGGVTFNATPLPAIDDPIELLDPIFTPTSQLTSEQWQDQLKQAVINQVSGGSRIFVLEKEADAAATALGGGTVTAGLKDAFDAAGYPVDAPVVTALTPGALWLIEADGARYIVESKGGGTKLDVSTALLVLDGIPTPTTGPVSAELVAAFAAADMVLATSATVAPVPNATGVWKVTDDAREYILTARGSKLAVTGGAGTKDDLDDVIRIEAGATLFSQNLGGPAAAEKVFRADVDIIITTDGRFLINSVATLADKVSFDLKLYADLNPLVDPSNTAPLSLVTLATFPSASSGLPQVAQLRGKMTFEFLNGDTPVNPTAGDPFDTFRFKILGYAEAGTEGTPKLVIQGDPAGTTFEQRAALLGLTVKTGPSTKVDLDVSGKLSVEGGALGNKLFSESAGELNVAGRLTFNKPENKPLEVFGALKLTFAAGLSGGPKFLKDAGLSAEGEFLLGLNATPDAQDVELTLPGAEPVTITLDPKSLMLEVQGSLRLGASGPGPLSSLGAAVTFDGVAAFKLSVGRPNGPANGVNVDVFVAGQLEVTATAAGKNLTLFSMQGLGLFAIRDLGTETLASPIPKLAARVDLKASAGLPGVYEYAGSAQLLLNTTGEVFTYDIPARLQDRLTAMQAAAGLGPLTLAVTKAPGGGAASQISVPAAPPVIVPGATAPGDGPYFYVAFGDLNSERSGSNTDPDNDGVVDVSLTVLNAFRLEGDLGLSVSSQGFQLAASARASLAAGSAANLFDARMTGLLTIDGTGLIGALAVKADAQAPSLGIPGLSAAGSLTFYMGLNTTANTGTITSGTWSRPILPQSAEVYIGGSLTLGGFEVEGSFRLFAGATAAGLEVDGKLSLFDLDIFTVSGDATIYFPNAPGGAGLVVNANVAIGNGGVIGVKNIFEIGGSLTLQLDTRAGGYARVAAENLTVSVLSAIEFHGSGSITVVGGADPYTRLAGSFSADLFGAFTVSASGWFDSRGYFDIDLSGRLKLGSDDFGIQAGFDLFATHPSPGALDFGGSGYGKVRAFGITLAGAEVAVAYASQALEDGDGKITAKATVTVLGISKSVNITLGYLVLPQPIVPKLAVKNGSTLTLNVGEGNTRGVRSRATDEAYQIESVTLDDGRVATRVRAFGYKEDFFGITHVAGNFGSGADQLRVRPRRDGAPLPFTVDVNGGGGDDLLIDESGRGVTLRGGDGNDILLGGDGADALFGDADHDTLAGGAGVDTLDGGEGNDELVWEAGRGADVITAGTGADTLAVTGGDAAETFALGAAGANLQVGVTANAATQTVTAAGVEKVRVDGRAGADTVTVPAGVLAGIGVTAVDVDLSRIPTAPTGTGKAAYAVSFQDDGSLDTVEVTGTGGADAFTVDALADAQAGDRVRVIGAGVTVGVVAPGAADDVLRVKGDAGDDTFTLAGPNSGSEFAGRRVKVRFEGEGGNDTARMPVGGANFDGGPGQNTAAFTVAAGDHTTLTLSGTQVAAANGQASAYSGLAEAGVEAAVPVALTVQGTHANTTRLALSGGTVDVAATAGPLAITSAGNTNVTLAATGAGKASTFGRAAGGAGGDRLTVGAGLLSAVAGPVTATNIDAVTYDNALDGAGRAFALTDAGLTGGGGGTLAHAGARDLGLRLGKGNDTASVAVAGAAAFVTDAGGSDAVVVTVAGTPAVVGTRFDAATGTVSLVTTKTGVEAVTFLNTGNTARTDWVLDQGRLIGGGRKLLDANPAGVLAVTLGEGGTPAAPNTAAVLRTAQPTSVTVRGATALAVGGELGNVSATLDEVDHPLSLLASGGGANTLTLDDTRSPEQAGRTRTFARGTVTGTSKQGGAITYDPAAFPGVAVNLGPADDVVTFAGAAGYGAVSGGKGADRLTVSGNAGSTLAIDGGDGNDLLTLVPGADGTAAGTVGFAGGADTDQAVLDATSLPANRSGNFTGAVVSVAGVPALNLTAPATVEQVTVKLGAGNDTFDITTTAYDKTFVLEAGGGDDTATVHQLPADGAGQYQLGGQAGQDTVVLKVAGVPVNKQFFAVAPTAEELEVDNRAGTAKVDWAVTGTLVTGNGVGVVSTLGADRLNIRAGTNTADAVTVRGTGAGPLEAEVDGDRVAAFEGLNVLSPAGGPVNTLGVPVTVDGLGGARSVAATADGRWVFAAGLNEVAGVAVLERTGSGSQTQLRFDRTVALPGDLAPTALVAGTRSGQQYLYVTDLSGTTARFHTYRIDPATGVLTLIDTDTAANTAALVRLVAVAPNGGDTVNVLAVEPEGAGRELLNFAIDTAGNPTAAPQRVSAGVPTTGGDPAVSPDGTRVYLPDSAVGRVAIYDRNDAGTLTYANAPNTLSVGVAEQAQVAGTLLLTFNRTAQSITVYQLSADASGNRPLRVVQTITGVSGGDLLDVPSYGVTYRTFDYDPANQVLAVLTRTGATQQVRTYKLSGGQFASAGAAVNLPTGGQTYGGYSELVNRYGRVAVVGAFRDDSNGGSNQASTGRFAVYTVATSGALTALRNETWGFQTTTGGSNKVALPAATVVASRYTADGASSPVDALVVSIGTPLDGPSDSDLRTIRVYRADTGDALNTGMPTNSGHPLATAAHPTGQVVWSIERTNAAGARQLEATVLRQYRTSSSDTNKFPVRSLALTGPLAGVDRVIPSPDGAYLYLIDTGSNGVFRAPVSLVSYGGDVPAAFGNLPFPGTFTEVADGTVGLNAADLAFGAGTTTRAYAVGLADKAVAVLTPNTSATPVFSGSAVVVNNGDVWDTGRVTVPGQDPVAVAVSPDGTRLYVGTNGNTVATVLPGAEGMTVEGTAASDPAGVAALLRSGNTLFAATTGGTLRRFTVGANSALTAVTTDVLTDTTDLRLADPKGLALGGGATSGFVFAAAENAVSVVPLTGGALGSAASVRAVADGDTYQKPLAGLSAGTASADGRWVYGVSAADNAFVAYDTQTGTQTGFRDGGPGTPGLGGVAFVARAANGGQDYVYALSPAEGVLTAFLRDFNGTVTVAGTYSLTGFAGATGMAYYPDQGRLYVVSGGTLYTYSLYPGAAPAAQTSLAAPGAAGVFAAQGRVFVTFPTAGEVRQYPFFPNTTHFTLSGLAGASAVAATADRLFVTSADGKLRVYGRNGDAAPTLQQTFTNGVGGVQGLLGAAAVEATADGRYVFVAGKAEGAVAVFALVDGSYRFAQVVRDGRGGVNGIAAPLGLAVRGTTLTVTSATGAGAAAGGFAKLTFPAAGAAAPPIRLDTRFEAAEAFTLRTYTPDANGNDTANLADVVRVLRAPTAGVRTVTIDTGGNDDTVAVADLGPRAANPNPGAAERFTLALGAGADTATITQTVARTAGRDLTVTAGAGSDEVSVVALPAGMAAAVNLNAGGSDIDIVRVKGTGVPSSSSVAVTGDLASGSVQAGTFAGDALFYDPDGRSYQPLGAASAGTISLTGSPARGGVSFSGLNGPGASTPQVFIQSPPQVAVAAAATNEGQGVELNATLVAGTATGWAWDLNGDGVFNDAYTQKVTLTWAQLNALGIDDDGAYPVAVRATNAANPQAFGGRSYALSADAAGTLTVANVAPTVRAPDTKAQLQDPYRLRLDATGDPGNDRVTGWAVQWATGGPREFYGAATPEVVYQFPAPGTYRVTVWAFDEDRPNTGSPADGYSVFADVVVTADAKAVSAGGPYTVAEGDGLTLTAAAAGTPAAYRWDLTNDGVIDFTTTGPTLALTWADLTAAGAGDDGRYRPTVTARYGTNGALPEAKSDTGDLTVTNTLPTGAVVLNQGAVAEGLAASPVTVRVQDAADPSAADLAGLTVRYDWDNDGTFDTPASAALTTPVTVPPQYLTDSGLRTVRAGLFDDRGRRDLFAVLNVTDVAPAVESLAPEVKVLAEGGTVALRVKAADPGDAITKLVIDWGDGSPVEAVAVNARAVDLITPAHRYGDGGPGAGTTYPVTVAVVTAEATTTATTAVTVTDVAPTVVLTADPTSPPKEGVAGSLKLTVAVTDPAGALDPVSAYTVDWGDGTTDAVTGDVTELAHTYARAGRFLVRVTALTNDDATFTGPALPNGLFVDVADAPPVIDTRAGRLGVPAAGEEAAPVLLSATAASVATGSEPLTFVWEVTGPNGFTDRLDVVGAVALAGADDPAGFEYVSRAGWSFTPPDDGDYEVTLTVIDGDGSAATVTRTVTVANRAPAITRFEVPAAGTEAQPLTLRAAATDPAGPADPLAYTWTVAGPGGTATYTGPEVTLAPAGGAYTVTLVVSDGDGGTDTRTAALAVANLAPVLSAVEVPAAATEGDTVTVRATAADPGGAALTYTWRVARPGLPLLVLSGPEASFAVPDDGAVSVSLTVADPAGLTATATRTIAVANAAPAVTGVTVPDDGTEGVALSFAAAATDPAGAADVLTYRWVVRNAAGAVVATLGGPNPQFTPPNQGTFTVELAVTDDAGSAAPATGVRTVEVANANPVLLGTPKAAPDGPVEGDAIALSLTPATKNGPVVADVAADLPNVRYTWVVTGPNGFRYESAPAATPAAAFTAPDDGAYTATVTATDGDGGSASRTVQVGVANADPVVATYSVPTTGYVGHAVPLAAAATDRGGANDPLTFTWAVTGPDGQPVAAPAGAASGFTPAAPGTYAVVLTVTDGDGGSAARTFTVEVAATPIRVVTFDAPAAGTEGAAVRLRATAVDDRGAAGGTPVLTWTITPPAAVGAPFVLTGPDVTFTPPDNGTYEVLLTAAVGNDLVIRTAAVAVANAAPTLTRVSIPGAGKLGVAVPLSAAATDPAGPADPLATSWRIIKPSGEEYTLTGTDPSFTPDASGLYGVRVEVTDGDGGRATAAGVVAVLASPPTASAGGPYSVAEGGSVRLDALAGSSDPDQPAATLVFDWDFDGDGAYGEATTAFGDERGATPTFAAGDLDGPAVRSVAVRVTDADGLTTFAEAQLAVANAAPTATAVAGPANVAPGQSFAVTLTAADASAADRAAGFTFRIDWDGNGTVDEVVTGPSGTTATHTYPAAGAYTARVVAVDKDGGVGPEAQLAVRADRVFLAGGDLYVYGTDGSDVILVGKSGSGVQASVNGVPTATYYPTGAVKVFGLGGGDILTGLPGLTRRLELYGGPGSDVLLGGGGADLIDGGDGDDLTYGSGGGDVVLGGAGSDVLAAGSGSDRLEGGPGSDVLVGGSGADTLLGGDGDDVLAGGGNHDSLDGGRGNDVVAGEEGNDTLLGGEGDDVLDGGNGQDRLDGGAGFLDTLAGGNGDDYLFDADGVGAADGGSGDDALDLTFAAGWNRKGSVSLPTSAVTGGKGNDTLSVTSHAPALSLDLNGEEGNDAFNLFGVWGRVRLYGGSGSDTATVRGTGAVEYSSVETRR